MGGRNRRGLAVSGAARMSTPSRIPSGGFRELGPINWGISKLGARAIRAPEMHLLTILGQNRRLFLAWLPFQGALLMFGKMPRRDSELVILRVGHLRNSAYELQQHRRIAKRFGLDPALQDRIFEGPQAEGLTERQRALLAATDELVTTRDLSAETYAALSRYLSRAQIIEFCMLAGEYDALAATMNVVKMPLDFPE